MDMSSFLQKYIPHALWKTLTHAYMNIKLMGSTYTCPLCGRSYRKFYAAGFDFPVLRELDVVGGGFRENVRCPGCNSGDRERLFFLYMRDVLKVETAKLTILQVAPEESVQKVLKSLKNISHESVDLDSPRADKKMDVQNLLYASETFDIVICNHVLEHIIDDLRAMRELHRVLKKGGTAILQVPISHTLTETFEDSSVQTASDRERVFGQSDHVRIYAQDYEERLRTCGFSVQAIPYAHVVGEELTRKYALNPRENLYVCTK
jgi:SAM-dependent methyltransferase